MVGNICREKNLLQRHHLTRTIDLCCIASTGKSGGKFWRKRVSQLLPLLFVSLATFVSNFRGGASQASQFTGITTFELWTDIGSGCCDIALSPL